MEKGDKVITTPATFVSTANAIVLAGAEPVFADIDISNYNISPERVEDMIDRCEGRIKAIIPVHLYGYPCDMDALLEISDRYNIRLIEDVSQAHGAKYDNKIIGSIGDTGAFSFYPTKVMTVGADGGMITTNNQQIAERCDGLRNQGRAKADFYTYDVIGYSARLSSINAAIGKIQLRHIDEWNGNRSKIAHLYLSELNGIGDIKLPPATNARYGRVWYTFAIRTAYRDKLKEYLEKQGIGCEIIYKIPVHLQPPYRKLGFKEGMYPNTERWANEILNIPIHSMMKEEEAGYVIEHIKMFYNH
ncbi:dTDP-3-amino-3,4,6-trideoxy-alpha-D-glucose transaminase [subsurface metagenome]